MSDKLKLSNQICFPFYAISRKIIKGYIPLLKKLDLTYPQYLIMLLLWEKDGILVKDICNKLYLETNTISPILVILEKKGFIYKSKKEGNNKEIFVYLSSTGSLLKQTADNIPSELLSKYDIDLKYLNDLHKNLWNFIEILDKKDK